jgi:uncharacterized membrane protein
MWLIMHYALVMKGDYLKKTKNIILVVLIIMMGIFSYTLDRQVSSKVADLNLEHILSNDDFIKVTVLEVVDETLVDDGFGGEVINIQLQVLATSPPYTNDILDINIRVHDPETEIYPFFKDDELLLNMLVIDDQISFSVVTYQREKGLLWLVALFVGLVILIGRFKGLRSLLALVFSIHVILRLLIPTVLISESLILPSFLYSIYILIGSFLIIGGLSNKSIQATLGSLIGITLSSLLAVYFLTTLKMSGILDEQSFFLLNLPGIAIDLRGILFTSITIGSLGAIMDVSMSLSSALQEIDEPHKSIKSTVVSAYHMSADMIATMTNTLILAYVGASLSMLVLMAVYGQPSFFIFNSEYYAFELMMGLIGSLGLILTLPATTLIFVIFKLIQKRTSH